MTAAQRITSGFPFPVYVNETATKQRIASGVYVDETVAATSAAPFSKSVYVRQAVNRASTY